MKTLRICNSEFLPVYQDRSPDYIYFLYDKLEIYIEKTQYFGLYTIIDTLPDASDPHDKPVPNMLYITMDGDVHVFDDEHWKTIAEIEDTSQTEYLTKAGTTFLIKSGYRYIDSQQKVLCLPYQNGVFQLSVIVDKPIMIDNQTIIVYNEETGHFEIDGERYYDEFGRNPEIMKYTADETNTVKTYIQNDHIHADVKLSAKVGNTIQIRTDGLYVGEKDFASIQEFEALVTRAQAQMTAFNSYMTNIEEALAHVDITLSDETLRMKIQESLHDYQANIDEAINNYAEIVARYEELKQQLINHIYETLNEYRVDTVDRINQISNAWNMMIPWFKATLTATPDGYDPSFYNITIDYAYKVYYTMGKQYLYPDQNIADLGYIQIDPHTMMNLNPGDVVTFCYAHINNDIIEAKSCAICVAE